MSSTRVQDLTPVRVNTPPAADVFVQPEIAATAPNVPEDMPATMRVIGTSASSPTTWDDHLIFFILRCNTIERILVCVNFSCATVFWPYFGEIGQGLFPHGAGEEWAAPHAGAALW